MYCCVLWRNNLTKAFFHVVVEVSRLHSIMHTLTHTHNRVRLLWKSDQIVTQAPTFTIHNIQKRRKSMLSAGIKPTSAAIESDGRIAP